MAVTSIETAGAISEGAALAAVPGGTADGLLARAAAAHPDRPAVLVPGRTVTTFAELDRQADGYARALHARLGAGAVVLVSAVPTADFPALYHGVIRSGNIVAPANPLYPPHLLAHVLTVSRARAAVVTPEVLERLRPLRDRLPALEQVFVIGEAAADAPSVRELLDEPQSPVAATDPATGPATADPEATACVLFTSGSTRMPKPVRLSHRNLLTGAVQLSSAHGQDADSVVLNGLPIYHPMHMNASLHVGAPHVLSGGDVATAVEAAAEHGATHFYTLPFRLVELAFHPRLSQLSLGRVRLVATGGLPVRPAVLRALDRQFGVPVLQGYGMCETSSLATSDLLADQAPGSVGRPLPGSRIRVVDLVTGIPLPADAAGEIQIQGPNVMQGYLSSDVPPAVDAEGWLSTGDVGRLDEAGHLFFLDRVRDVFHTDGVLVSPGAIESVLSELPGVAEAAVVELADGEGVEGTEAVVPVGYVVLRAGNAQDAAAAETLRERANALLAAPERLRRLEVLDTLPRLPNAKVDRTALRVRAAGAPQ